MRRNKTSANLNSEDENSSEDSISKAFKRMKQKHGKRSLRKKLRVESDESSDENSNKKTTSTVMPLSKRGRGRPRKSQLNLDDSHKSDNEDESSNDGTSVVTPVSKRGRGRARKSQVNLGDSDKNDNESSNDATSVVTPVSKRGRGRLRKSQVNLDDSDKSDNEDESSNDATSVSKRRVRPRKSQVNLDDSEESDNENITCAVNGTNSLPSRLRTGPSTRMQSRITINSSNSNATLSPQRNPSCVRTLSPQPGPSHVRTFSPQHGPSRIRTLSSQPRSSGDRTLSPQAGPSGVNSQVSIRDVRNFQNIKASKEKEEDTLLSKRQNLGNSVSEKRLFEDRQKENDLNKKNLKHSSFNSQLVESLAQKLVYFLLIEDQKKYAIKKKAIIAHVFKDEVYSAKLYTAVVTKANSILKKTYGMELLEVENQKDGYVIVNILRRELGIDDYIELSKLKQIQQGLILYLLTVIFMNENVITEDDLEKALKPLKIDLSSKIPHPIFGDVKKFITSELVKQLYINYECVSKDPRRYEITWGVRAKEEVDKRDLLKFACQVMNDTVPESWILQFRDAEKSAAPV